MLLQQVFYVPLESTCCIFFAYCHEFCNRKSCNEFVLPLERELLKSPVCLINHGKELQELVLFIKLLVFTKINIPKSTLESITKH